MISAFFHFQHTLNKLLSNCIKLLDRFFLKYKGGSNYPPFPEETTIEKPSLIRVNIMNEMFDFLKLYVFITENELRKMEF